MQGPALAVSSLHLVGAELARAALLPRAALCQSPRPTEHTCVRTGDRACTHGCHLPAASSAHGCDVGPVPGPIPAVASPHVSKRGASPLSSSRCAGPQWSRPPTPPLRLHPARPSPQAPGVLPDALAELAELRELRLSAAAHLTGTLPASALLSLAALEVLELTRVNVSGTLPAGLLASLPLLDDLALSGTRLSGCLAARPLLHVPLLHVRPRRISSLGTRLSGTLPLSVGEAGSALEELTLRGAPLGRTAKVLLFCTPAAVRF